MSETDSNAPPKGSQAIADALTALTEAGERAERQSALIAQLEATIAAQQDVGDRLDEADTENERLRAERDRLREAIEKAIPMIDQNGKAYRLLRAATTTKEPADEI